MKHVLAHYRYPVRKVMRKLTIGQVLVLFDGMAQYVVLTNPFGSGDGASPKTAKTGGVKDAMFQASYAGIAPAGVLDLKDLDPALRDLILQNERDLPRN